MWVVLEGRTSMEEVPLWRNRYRVLFDHNIVGVILTTADGRIADCNEACARIFGFDSRTQMLTHTVWDFYFDKAERETLIKRLQSARGSLEEACFRGRDGEQVWVLATCTELSFAEDRLELLQGTLVDITAQKKAQARRQNDTERPASVPENECARMTELSQTITTLLGHVSEILQPNNLPRIDRAEVQECVLSLEQMKMLVSELEMILHLPAE